MKNLYFVLLYLASMLLWPDFANAGTGLTDDSQSRFTAKVNGKEWKGGVIVCDVGISSVEFFGFGDDKNGIRITLQAAPGEGTFEINNKSAHKIAYGSAETNYTLGKADAGKVIVTKYDAAKKLFSGTFEVTLTNGTTGKKVNITNGVFTNLAFYDKPKKDFEFKARLNGAKWNWSAASGSYSKDTINMLVTGTGKKFLSLKFPGNTPAGEYTITQDSHISAYYKSFEDKNDAGLKPKTGRLIIQENNIEKKTITGQFEIEMVNDAGETKAKFTDGSFTVFYKD